MDRSQVRKFCIKIEKQQDMKILGHWRSGEYGKVQPSRVWKHSSDCPLVETEESTKLDASYPNPYSSSQIDFRVVQVTAMA